MNEDSGASEWSEPCGASEWVGGASIDLISLPIVLCGSLKKSWQHSSPFADSIPLKADFSPSLLIFSFFCFFNLVFFFFNENSCEFAFYPMQSLKTIWKPDKNIQMSHELGREWSGERTSERREVGERSKQYGAWKTSDSEWMVRASEWSSTDLPIPRGSESLILWESFCNDR